MAIEMYITEEVSFVTAEMQAAIDWRRNIEQLWFLCEQGSVVQIEVAPIARALGYGNASDCIQITGDGNYWGAVDTLLLLVLAAEGEELPS